MNEYKHMFYLCLATSGACLAGLLLISFAAWDMSMLTNGWAGFLRYNLGFWVMGFAGMFIFKMVKKIKS